MVRGIDISRQFCQEVVTPLLEECFPELAPRIAIGTLGTGSDTIGLDDDLSRDHHWGPRINLILSDRDHADHGAEVLAALKGKLPRDYRGYPIGFPKWTRGGVSVESIGYYFRCFAKMEEPPKTDLEWFRTTEADLFHLTRGTVFYDPYGEFSRRQQGFAYYPDPVWKKKVADWCLYFTGSTSPYNVNRCARRGDFVAAEMFFGIAIKRAIELCFLLNRTYAPYTKWLSRLVPTLPKLGTTVDEEIKQAIDTKDWDQKVRGLIRIAHAYANELHSMGLTGKPTLKEYDPTFADLTLYESALQLYRELPEEMLHGKFNEEEWWEFLAREVLFDSDDYFQKRLGS